jgi:hypothetical protein
VVEDVSAVVRLPLARALRLFDEGAVPLELLIELLAQGLIRIRARRVRLARQAFARSMNVAKIAGNCREVGTRQLSRPVALRSNGCRNSTAPSSS